MNQIWFGRNGTDLVIEQTKYLVYFVEPERWFSLLQIANEPQTYASFVSQLFLG